MCLSSVFVYVCKFVHSCESTDYALVSSEAAAAAISQQERKNKKNDSASCVRLCVWGMQIDEAGFIVGSFSFFFSFSFFNLEQCRSALCQVEAFIHCAFCQAQLAWQMRA